MDFVPVEHTTPSSSATPLPGGARSGVTPAYLRASRGVSTPPPQRPRLFARASVARGSPPPPARLAPISSSTPCVPLPQRTASESVHRSCVSDSFNCEERGLPGAWPIACGEPAGARPLMVVAFSAYEGSLLREGDGVFGTCATDLNTAPPPARVEPLLRRKMVPAGALHAHVANGYSSVASEGMTADDSSSSAAGVTELSSAAQSTAAVPLMHSIGRTKRHRMVSSADTQHSLASSTLPLPRCHRTSGHGSIDGESASQRDVGFDASMTRALPSLAGRYLCADHDEETDGAPKRCGSGSNSSSCSSRGAVSYSASSTRASVADVPEKLDMITRRAGQRAFDNSAAGAQCLVIEDSVDTDAVVTPAQLQQMKAEAAGGGVHRRASGELSTLYESRLVTADVLRDWTGWEDLDLVLTAQLRVDADAMIGVNQIGAQLSSLSSLKLNGSRICRVRQLGTGFHALKYLWLNSCHVTDLYGIAACCPSLVELYVPFNRVRDVTPVMALSATLEVLDVEGNLLDDAADLGAVLTSLHGVRALSLLGNPLTCEHQARVRDAYRVLLVEGGCRAGTNTAASGDVLSPVPPPSEHKPFSHVLAAWVRLLMPQLETLNDAAIDVSVTSSCASSPLHGSSPEEARRRLAAPVSTHVDPLDDALAEELRLVEECVRGADAFDALLAAVDEANRHVYTRPSTSCSGAQPRLAPRTAMGVARPFTSRWSRAPVRLGSCGGSTTDASVLTTGGVLAGNATASLRRRLATPSMSSTDAAQNDPSATSGSAADPAGCKGTSAQRNGISPTDARYCASVTATSTSDLDEDAHIAALLADDSEEEEWEHFKASLLRSKSSSAAPIPRLSGPMSTSAAAAASYHPFLYTQNEEAAATASMLQADGFEKELRTELTRLRMRIAKESRE
ncbi:conserved hypothetical protein [Leishmania mexicana MHOM/GT/2001/U1103]|uniref:Leucine-rich repeat protein (LRRP) n=1 Tax=Leishmania mexicana (strain MHOM/GT/2001/U1103) TaxID=929439 RepID=E9AS05_LEIMU|nr:conserved hypothetical protein [Leishmania mexicana MHOM/GT/2001/U1103]CBZ25726.1 conserved hypothetical protein [Leishmania mexicana MHOM/GT/2001/U1103]